MPLEVPPWIGTIKVLNTYSCMNLICRGESGKRRSFEKYEKKRETVVVCIGVFINSYLNKLF